jgi:membrane-bound ClpP family serine protease
MRLLYIRAAVADRANIATVLLILAALFLANGYYDGALVLGLTGLFALILVFYALFEQHFM